MKKTSLCFLFSLALISPLTSDATTSPGSAAGEKSGTSTATTDKAKHKNAKLSGFSPRQYVVTWTPGAEAEEGRDIADSLNTRLAALGLDTVAIDTVNRTTAKKIISITHSPGTGTFDYRITTSKGRVNIDGGGCWAMQQAIRLLTDKLRKGTVPAGWQAKGSVEGKCLFTRAEGSTLRILDDNIWQYDSEKIPEVWQKAGYDCRDDVRAPKFAQLVRGYMPDVVSLQEYSKHMHDRFYPLIQKYGYKIAYNPPKDWNYTPIFYDTLTTELVYVHYNRYAPEQWSNLGTKSFTSAVFKLKNTGKTFAILNTHLWWKDEIYQVGSDMARASQTRLMMAEAEIIKAKYHCPIFVMGDMNCTEAKPAMQQFLTSGYMPCYKLATVSTDSHNGHHICGPKRVGRRQWDRPTPHRDSAIDHILLYNAQDSVEIKTFKCEMANFTIKITDHYPNVVDATLK